MKDPVVQGFLILLGTLALLGALAVSFGLGRLTAPACDPAPTEIRIEREPARPYRPGTGSTGALKA